MRQLTPLPIKLLIILTMVIFLSACGSDSQTKADPRDTLQKQWPDDVSQLIRYFEEVRRHGLMGHMDTVLAMRDSVTVKFILDYYAFRNGTLDSTTAATWAWGWPHVAGLPIVQDTMYDNWRRLIFYTEGVSKQTMEERAIYPVLMFRQEHSGWKFSNAMRLEDFKYDGEGNIVVRSDFRNLHDLFRLPPEFPVIDSLKMRDGPTPQPIE